MKITAPDIGSVMGPGKMNDHDADDTKYDDYAVKDAADTIARAQGHMADPKMMAKVAKHADGKIRDLKTLRKMASKKALEGN